MAAIETDIDRIIGMLKASGRVELEEFAARTGLDRRVLESWAHLLEKHHLVKIDHHMTKVYLTWIDKSGSFGIAKSGGPEKKDLSKTTVAAVSISTPQKTETSPSSIAQHAGTINRTGNGLLLRALELLTSIGFARKVTSASAEPPVEPPSEHADLAAAASVKIAATKAAASELAQLRTKKTGLARDMTTLEGRHMAEWEALLRAQTETDGQMKDAEAKLARLVSESKTLARKLDAVLGAQARG